MRAASGALLLALVGGSLALPVSRARAVAPQIALLDRPVQRGEVLARSDLAVATADARSPAGALTIREAIGKETTRALSAGAFLRAEDLMGPRLVRRGEQVTINVRAAGLAITAQGKALSAGGMGDVIRVFSTATNRTFDATVEGPDAVRLVSP